jgi:predicted ThiF/HesA family dinucleotide-utilizing enzyme
VKRIVRSPTTELLAARRSLEGLKGALILEDWCWDEGGKNWTLRLRLTPDLQPTDHVPASSDWVVCVDEIYPWGSIVFYPAVQNGLTSTFPHQSCNLEDRTATDRRKGKLCLDTPLRSFKRHQLDDEPFEADDRLRWHTERALNWLVLASRDELSPAGEVFELPDFPVGLPDTTVAFAETLESLDRWKESSSATGFVEVIRYRSQPDVFVVSRYLTLEKEPLIQNAWGAEIRRQTISKKHALWLLLPEIPILPPWQAPRTWRELRDALHQQGVDFDSYIESLFKRGVLDEWRLLLLGFPIPTEWQRSPERYWWQAVRIPALHSASKPVPGFRPNAKTAWWYNQTKILKDDSPLLWVRSENWSADQLASRGTMESAITSKRIVLIGGGAVGSAVAEMLMRGGCQSLTVVDPDRLRTGNLVRHTLTLDDVEENKGTALARRLNKVGPHTDVDYVDSSFPPEDIRAISKIRSAEVVIDCTGSDEVIEEMARFDWQHQKAFCSIALGARGQRVFVFGQRAVSFPADDFRSSIAPWLVQERQEVATGPEFPREGIGCWHPAFPARTDDIWLLSATAVKSLERFLNEDGVPSLFAVYEQVEDHGTFAGVAPATLEKTS